MDEKGDKPDLRRRHALKILAGSAVSLLFPSAETLAKPKRRARDAPKEAVEEVESELTFSDTERQIIEHVAKMPTHDVYMNPKKAEEVARPFVPPDRRDSSNSHMSRWPTTPLVKRHGGVPRLFIQGIKIREDVILLDAYSLMALSREAGEHFEEGINFIPVRHKSSKTFQSVPILKPSQFMMDGAHGKQGLITGFRLGDDLKFTPRAEVGTAVDLATDHDLARLAAKVVLSDRGVPPDDVRTRSSIEKILKNSIFIKTRSRGPDGRDEIRPGGLVTLADANAQKVEDAKVVGLVWARVLLPIGGTPTHVEGYLAQKSSILSHILEREPVTID